MAEKVIGIDLGTTNSCVAVLEGISATVIGHLFIRSSERAERIYAAMCARGWQ